MADQKLPRPKEPTEAKLKEYGENYNRGLAGQLEIDSVGDTLVIKQGMMGYLSEQWDQEPIPQHEIAKACGNANTPIEWWYKGEKTWDEVLDRISSSLNAEFI